MAATSFVAGHAMMSRPWAGVVAFACFACTAPGQQPAPSLIGKQAAEIVAIRDHWLGESQPATLEQLKGKVVWLHFTF